MTSLNSHDIMELCGAGAAIEKGGHPILQNLNNPVFNKILTYTDQAVLLINHATSTFEYVSENIANVTGISSVEFLAHGREFLTGLTHPDDLQYLNNTVYPTYYRCFDSVPFPRWVDLKFSHTARIRKANASYMQVLHQSMPLSFDHGKVLLALLTLTDVSAYKKGKVVAYKNMLIDAEESPTVLSSGLCQDGIFSKREEEILSLTGRGYSEKQIADVLSLSTHTIKTHRKNMLRKAGVRNAPALVHFGRANLII